MRKTNKGMTDKIMKIVGEIIHSVTSHLEHLLELGHRFASKVPYTTLNVFTIVYLIHSVLKIKTNWLFKRNKHILEGQLSRHLPGSTVKVFNNI